MSPLTMTTTVPKAVVRSDSEQVLMDSLESHHHDALVA
jgi:hypothetical protein